MRLRVGKQGKKKSYHHTKTETYFKAKGQAALDGECSMGRVFLYSTCVRIIHCRIGSANHEGIAQALRIWGHRIAQGS